MKYSIVEWNIDRKTSGDNNLLEKIKELMKKNPIIILTEVCAKARNYIEEELLKKRNDYVYEIKKVSNIEYVIIMVQSELKIEICSLNKMDKARISSIKAKIELGQKEISICGLRIHTQCGILEFKEQIKYLIEEVKDNKPDIIIGDFNWASTIGKYITRILCQTKESEENKKLSLEIYNYLDSVK